MHCTLFNFFLQKIHGWRGVQVSVFYILLSEVLRSLVLQLIVLACIFGMACLLFIVWNFEPSFGVVRRSGEHFMSENSNRP